MNRISRAAVATAMAAAVALGASAPAAVAGPPEHAKGAHAKAGKAEKAKGPAKVDRLSAQLERRLDRQISRKHAFLTRIAGSDRLANLGANAELVKTNVTADLTALTGLTVAVDAATTVGELKELAADVRAVRPEVYNRIISQVRRATAMQALAVEVPEAASLLAGALDTLAAFSATTPRSELRAMQSVLAQAAALLEAVEVPEESVEPAPEENLEPAPGDTDPIGEQDPAV
jgi:hypothetical protein